MADLYYIQNVGCDDVTCGLAAIPEDVFPLFKNIIENLNKNSECSCMPTINVYKIDESFVRPATGKDASYDILHMNDGQYTLKNRLYEFDEHGNWVVMKGAKKVI